MIGVLRPRAQDIFTFEPQIVTAGMKTTPGQHVVAFGQAVAYRLFSHKGYIVVPRTTTSDDMSRLTSLCSIHGVGLVVFTLGRELLDYAVVVLPTVANPDLRTKQLAARRSLLGDRLSKSCRTAHGQTRSHAS